MSKPALSGLFICVFAVAGAMSGCGGGSGNNDAGSTSAASSGVDGTKTISSLTQADLKKLCDWTASLYGGYGGKTVCTETIEGPANQAECLAQAAVIPSSCKATVSQVETCTRAISTCDPSDDVSAAAACTAMMACLQ